MAGLVLRSPAFNDHDLMPERLSRQGGNISPPLQWSGVPAGAAELVLLCEDPDAGREPFLHWLVTQVDPRAGEVAEGQVPARGHEWANGFGATGWDGPQPPLGDDPHRYFFHLYALSRPLALPDRPSVADVRRAARKDELASGTLVGTFAR
ncbi:YbhB/YbcL family Raf kinase inhibitor-like protein [Phytohabitans sp. ZYX-F-186]|uniref:YbhB/YbcL family Raf kinase inhibitor-like protein n=1 Tax=Phytohabitans maris TaxID=3071409 RepID=A0ABU0ZYI6_9ACTN|nr:YbhB/YbcL family Raf kinase inhibitor-like protein [Phytohabitans sp. ZYX-F-186]MDQ7911240.1 YbhB/YbcL family Raf kinase inhibitor-like protein [Phytohabitans sp. ZYX-F-186]